jgi:hypothetical protein
MHKQLAAVLALVLTFAVFPAYAGTGGPYDGAMTALLAVIVALLAALLWCCYRKRGP